MKNFVQSGNTITLTAPYAVGSGEGLLVGSIFGIPAGAAAIAEPVETALVGVRVEIDSNRVENLMRPISLNRRNVLFAGHDEGGIAWGRIASLIETCKINGVEPFAYERTLTTAIARQENRRPARAQNPAWRNLADCLA